MERRRLIFNPFLDQKWCPINENASLKKHCFSLSFLDQFFEDFGSILAPKNHQIFKKWSSEGILWSSVASGMHLGLFLGSLGIDFGWFLSPWRSNSIDFGANGGQISANMEVDLCFANAFVFEKQMPETLNVEGLTLMIRATRSRSMYIYIYIYRYIYTRFHVPGAMSAWTFQGDRGRQRR